MADQPVDRREIPDEEQGGGTAVVSGPEGATPSETMEIAPEEAIARSEPLSVDNPQAQGQVRGKAPTEGGRKSGISKEHLPIIHPGMWVTLGDTGNVPEYVQGRLAAVLDAPRYECGDPKCKESPRRHEHQDDDAAITVQTRDEFDATLEVTREDITAVHANGKPLRG